MKKKVIFREIICFALLCGLLLGMNVFKLQKVQASDANFVIEDGVLKEYKGSKKNVKIPNSVKEIGSRAFYSLPVTSIKIPSSVKTIGEDAFMMTNLKKITIPKSVKKIGTGALFGCEDLKKVKILNP